MKVVLPSNAHRVSYQHSTVLSLVPEKITLTKENSITLKLRSIPTDANSTKYEYVARILNGTEGCRPALQFSKDLDAIWSGLNLRADHDGAGMDGIGRRLLTGAAFTRWENRFPPPKQHP